MYLCPVIGSRLRGFIFYNMKQVAIIGAGNLGTSLAKGLVEANHLQPEQITLVRRRPERLAAYEADGFQVTADSASAAQRAEVVILAVLPQKLDEVLETVKPALSNQLIISLVSGATIDQISGRLDNSHLPVIRAMPNTAIAIRESMTCIATKPAFRAHLNTVQSLFDQVGSTVIINEDQMTSATALCACGIAFFLRAIRAASQGGIEIDFHAGEALKMAAQTAKGAAALLLEHDSHPEDEIDRVTSPKGCTIAGLNHMEHNGFSSAFIKGITTSAQMAGQLYHQE